MTANEMDIWHLNQEEPQKRTSRTAYGEAVPDEDTVDRYREGFPVKIIHSILKEAISLLK